MKRFLIIIILALPLILSSCGSNTNDNSNKTSESNIEESPASTAASTPTEDPTSKKTSKAEDNIIDESLIKEYQGSWCSIGDSKHVALVISGHSVNYIRYGILDESDMVDGVDTFYFALDESNNIIIVNPYNQPRMNISLSKKKVLTISDMDPEFYDKDKYTKLSDSIEIPAIKEDPHIGMTKEDALNSKWGYPKRTNTTKTANRTSEQWVYEKGYLYFDNGILTEIQER